MTDIDPKIIEKAHGEFVREWGLADAEGDEGNRSQRGITAALETVVEDIQRQAVEEFLRTQHRPVFEVQTTDAIKDFISCGLRHARTEGAAKALDDAGVAFQLQEMMRGRAVYDVPAWLHNRATQERQNLPQHRTDTAIPVPEPDTTADDLRAEGAERALREAVHLFQPNPTLFLAAVDVRRRLTQFADQQRRADQ